MSAKHTPGPWDYFVGNANGRGLIRIEQEGTGIHIASMQRGEVSEANARLIAAAPELFQIVDDYCEDHRHVSHDMANTLLRRARAIRAKATGETP